MKAVRPLLIGAAVLLAVVLIGLGVALSSAFQTRVVRRMLLARPDLHLTIGRVSAGLYHLELDDVHFERNGVKFAAPAIVADLPLVPAVLRRRLAIERLVASACSLSFPGGTPAPASAAGPVPVPAAGPSGSAAAPAMPSPVRASFAGVLASFALPFDLQIARAELAGEVVLAGGRGSAHLQLTGGGLGAGRAGQFELTAGATLADDPVNSVGVRGSLTLAMDTPRTFTGLHGAFDVTAAGAQVSHPVTVRSVLEITRTAGAETCVVSITGHDRRLARVHADFPGPNARISGEWSLDVKDSDVAPFALGHPLPGFGAVGSGHFDTDAALTEQHVTGTLAADVDRLAVIAPTLSGVGPVKVKADLDLAQHAGRLTVTKLDVAVAAAPEATGTPAARNVATFRALQPFEFVPKSGELRASDAATDLIGIALQGLPLAWIRPFAPDLELSGTDVRGELTAAPRAGGFRFQSQLPLSVSGLGVSRAGTPLVRNLDLTLNTSGDYTPVGWQVEISGLTARTGSASVLLLDAKAGRLAGGDQPIKATGLLTVDLGALLTQPWAEKSAVTRGDATVEFIASIGAQSAIQANVTVKNLSAGAHAGAGSLPALTARVRADVQPGGTITVNAPLVLERSGRVSDLTVAGSFTPGAAIGFDAQVSSSNLVWDDAKALAGVLPAKSAPAVRAAPARPLWARLNGSVALDLKKVVYTGKFQMSHVLGTLRFSGGTVSFDQVQAAADDGGQAGVTGELTYAPDAAKPFSLGADVSMTDFDPAPFFRAENPRQPATIEGKFSVATKVNARAATLAGLPAAVAGDFELTSRGGTFRGLPVNVGDLVENSGKLATWLATAGSALTSLAGRKDYDEITSRSQAASELARILSSISYDQLALRVTRDANRNARVKEFTLISPEVRMTGSGQARSVGGASLLNDVVELELRLRARGRPAELMKYLGVLAPTTDDLGYAECTLPVRVEGSLGRLDTTELSNRLVALAVAKTGLTEKAVDWINRLRGKGQN